MGRGRSRSCRSALRGSAAANAFPGEAVTDGDRRIDFADEGDLASVRMPRWPVGVLREERRASAEEEVTGFNVAGVGLVRNENLEEVSGRRRQERDRAGLAPGTLVDQRDQQALASRQDLGRDVPMMGVLLRPNSRSSSTRIEVSGRVSSHRLPRPPLGGARPAGPGRAGR